MRRPCRPNSVDYIVSGSDPTTLPTPLVFAAVTTLIRRIPNATSGRQTRTMPVLIKATPLGCGTSPAGVVLCAVVIPYRWSRAWISSTPGATPRRTGTPSAAFGWRRPGWCRSPSRRTRVSVSVVPCPGSTACRP